MAGENDDGIEKMEGLDSSKVNNGQEQSLAEILFRQRAEAEQLRFLLDHYTRELNRIVPTARWSHFADYSRDENSTLKTAELETRVSMLVGEIAKARQTEKEASHLKEKIQEYEKLNRLRHLIEALPPWATEEALKDESLAERFDQSKCFAFVMSVDIRRSTELMLKARDPARFAQFLMDLCEGLRRAVWDCDGVFDKFTGDGILVFFPDFFTGEGAGFKAVTSAEGCHKVFREVYEKHLECFVSVVEDVGLGIGVDCGETHLVRFGGGLTVVGDPVVYACRLGGAPAGQTLVNHRAFVDLKKRYPAALRFEVTHIDVKNEGRTRAHRVTLTEVPVECPLCPYRRAIKKANPDPDAPSPKSAD